MSDSEKARRRFGKSIYCGETPAGRPYTEYTDSRYLSLVQTIGR